MNRAQRRAVKFREEQRPAPMSSTDCNAMRAARSVCVALGLEVDADNNLLLTDQQRDTNGEFHQCIARVKDALKAFDAPVRAFTSDLMPDSMRAVIAVGQTYIEAFDAAKATIERLKGESAPPDVADEASGDENGSAALGAKSGVSALPLSARPETRSPRVD